MQGHPQPQCYERYAGAAGADVPRSYRPRHPERTALYGVVREHLLTFLAEGCEKSASAEGYPYYVEKELRDFLGCAELSRGFARVRCVDCGHEILLPFSCKNRGICPSCTGRRMNDEAAYLADRLLPEASYRQWTLTFPWALRYQMAKDASLITAILNLCLRALFAWQRRVAKKRGHAGALTASVTFIQRFGGALNCNVHLHVLLPDGVFVQGQGDSLTWVRLPAPRDEEVLHLLHTIVRRVTRYCEKRFATDDDPPQDVLQGAISEAMQNLLAHGWTRERAPHDADPSSDTPVRTSKRCAAVDGFSIHANTAVAAKNRLGLERLCRYGLRPPFAHERLSLTEHGQVCLALRKPWPDADGVSELVFEPLAFLRRLAPLIPPPFAHLIRYHGLFGPNAKHRDLLPAAPVSPAGIREQARVHGAGANRPARNNETSTLEPFALSLSDPGSASDPSRPSPLSPGPKPSVPTPSPGAPSAHEAPGSESTPKRPIRQPLCWADLLRRVFALDVLVCPRCHGPMVVLACLTDPAVVHKILTHLRLPTAPPTLNPARRPEPPEQQDWMHEGDFLDSLDHGPAAQPRAHPNRGPPTHHDLSDTAGDGHCN